jgi:hypothetical protein
VRLFARAFSPAPPTLLQLMRHSPCDTGRLALGTGGQLKAARRHKKMEMERRT